MTKITVETLIEGINQNRISGYANYNSKNITGTGPLPVARFEKGVFLSDTQDFNLPFSTNQAQFSLEDYLQFKYLTKAEEMTGYRNDKNYRGYRAESKESFLGNSLNPKWAGNAPGLGAGAWQGGFIEFALKEQKDVLPAMGHPNGRVVSDDGGDYTVQQPNPFPVYLDVSLK